jgi:hypothetical protein
MERISAFAVVTRGPGPMRLEVESERAPIDVERSSEPEPSKSEQPLTTRSFDLRQQSVEYNLFVGRDGNDSSNEKSEQQLLHSGNS